ncbi:hypothetical protein, partial [Nonomuraea sp. NPDC049750]|uniref:hypothetical protein n=1 Tax=Nonomuraea sp. NPDC049750 TaxID=3154738 RepID=UPI0033CB331A
MATFVLNPPPEVRVVSFFITSRYAGHSDRRAFLEVVIEQLAELVGEPMPALLTEATQSGWFNRLLKAAAQSCRRSGTRLVLVIDGLDEDRGVKSGPNAHSIAALLPAVPADGMRVVVAGRHDPPVPSDVPAWHPLRDPGIVRMVVPSPAAQIIRDDAERELIHLLHGSREERNLLGFVVAAGGGLSSSDLAELTSMSNSEVEWLLRAVSGRTFSSSNSHWRPDDGAQIFVLAHEELMSAAVAALSHTEITSYRDRIHGWADKYRDQAWPAGTPEYLLRGYFRLLQDTGNLSRMIALATDRNRLDRMLDASGGDATTLAEIAACQGIIGQQDVPDLYAMLLLARTREFLEYRNTNIPMSLPGSWILVGNYIRGEALARSITEPYRQACALIELVGPLVKAGQLDRAEAIARSISNPKHQVEALSNLVSVLAEIGHLDHAHHTAQKAEELARSITDPHKQVEALSNLVSVLAEIGHLDHAHHTAQKAEELARS